MERIVSNGVAGLIWFRIDCNGGFYKHSSVPLGSKQGVILDQLNSYLLFMKDHVQWSLLAVSFVFSRLVKL